MALRDMGCGRNAATRRSSSPQPVRTDRACAHALSQRRSLSGLLPLGKSSRWPCRARATSSPLRRDLVTDSLLRPRPAGRPMPVLLGRRRLCRTATATANWWIPSGQVFYHPDQTTAPPQNWPRRGRTSSCRVAFRDPLANSTDTLTTTPTTCCRARPRCRSTTRSQSDERLPCAAATLVTDPNGNRSAGRLRRPGPGRGHGRHGQAGENLGDLLDGFEPISTEDDRCLYHGRPPGDPQPSC